MKDFTNELKEKANGLFGVNEALKIITFWDDEKFLIILKITDTYLGYDYLLYKSMWRNCSWGYWNIEIDRESIDGTYESIEEIFATSNIEDVQQELEKHFKDNADEDDDEYEITDFEEFKERFRKIYEIIDNFNYDKLCK